MAGVCWASITVPLDDRASGHRRNQLLPHRCDAAGRRGRGAVGRRQTPWPVRLALLGRRLCVDGVASEYEVWISRARPTRPPIPINGSSAAAHSFRSGEVTSTRRHHAFILEYRHDIRPSTRSNPGKYDAWRALKSTATAVDVLAGYGWARQSLLHAASPAHSTGTRHAAARLLCRFQEGAALTPFE